MLWEIARELKADHNSGACHHRPRGALDMSRRRWHGLAALVISCGFAHAKMHNLTITAALMLSVVHAYAEGFESPIANIARAGISAHSPSAADLLGSLCPNDVLTTNMDLKNAKFLQCLWYARGVADMLQTWREIDPGGAPACIPRSVMAGELIYVARIYIEANFPSRKWDAATALTKAFAEKWPCQR
jgi:hypothetical protein